jgi:mandelate racemase
MTRIRGLRSTIVSVPAPRRIISSVRDTTHVINVLVELDTDDGLTGISYVAGFTRHKARATCCLLEELGDAITGLPPDDIGGVWDRMWSVLTLVGHAGLPVFALSAIDIALWDLRGKRAGVPLYELLGGARHPRLAAYASDGCWLSNDVERVVEDAEGFVARGFSALKVRFGRTDPEDDLAVLRAVRHAVGDGVAIMVDVNQGWTPERVRSCGTALADCPVRWLEEPLPAEDLVGLAALRRDLPFELASGECAYLPAGVEALVSAGAVSVVMPDLQRVGGVTGWLHAREIAEAAGLLLSPHLFPEINVHLLATCAEPGPLEWVSWAQPLLEEPLSVKAGAVAPPNRPGLGIRFDRSAVRGMQLE